MNVLYSAGESSYFKIPKVVDKEKRKQNQMTQLNGVKSYVN